MPQQQGDENTSLIIDTTKQLEEQRGNGPVENTPLSLSTPIRAYIVVSSIFTVPGAFFGLVSYLHKNQNGEAHDLTSPLSKVSWGASTIGSAMFLPLSIGIGIAKYHQQPTPNLLTLLENTAPFLGNLAYTAGSVLLVSAHSEAGSTSAFKDPVHGDQRELAGGALCIAGAGLAAAGLFGRRAVNAASNAYDTLKNCCRR